MIQWKSAGPDPSAVRLVIPSGDGFTDCRRIWWLAVQVTVTWKVRIRRCSVTQSQASTLLPLLGTGRETGPDPRLWAVWGRQLSLHLSMSSSVWGRFLSNHQMVPLTDRSCFLLLSQLIIISAHRLSVRPSLTIQNIPKEKLFYVWDRDHIWRNLRGIPKFKIVIGKLIVLNYFSHDSKKLKHF